MNEGRRVRTCEIIWVKSANGWQWRSLDQQKSAKRQTSPETFQLYYDCVTDARAEGYNPNVKCL
jgi:hypothetical protein